MAKCKGCGAVIVFIKLQSGKLTPIDAKQKSFYYNPKNDEWVLLKGHELHFATCPKADQFRKKKK